MTLNCLLPLRQNCLIVEKIMECSDLLKSLGFRIRTLRNARGMSQEKLAEAAGVHPTYISDIELGKTKVNVCIINQIAKALGLRLSELFEVAAEVDDESVTLFVSQVRGLDDRQRKVFLTAAEMMLKGMQEF